MSGPRVSICIPAYRQVDYLREALRSVKEQSFEDYELIVSDDTPDDTVQQVVESFGFDNRLRYYRNPVSLGSPENWNAAVRQARGIYIKLLHHDDRLAQAASLGSFVRMLDEHPEADFAFSASLVESATTNKARIHRPTEDQLAAIASAPGELFSGNAIGAPSATIYRNGLGIEYDARMKWLVDVDFYVRVLTQNPRFVYTPDALVATTSDANHQITTTCLNNAELELREHMLLYRKVCNKLSSETHALNVWFRLFEKYRIYSQSDLERREIRFSADDEQLLQQLFGSYQENRLRRIPYRIYARLPQSLKRATTYLRTLCL